MRSAHIAASLRARVQERAAHRCEYCLIPDEYAFSPHHVDHVIAQKHGGGTDDANLALSCALCNRRKGTDLASIDSNTGEIANLFHPRRDTWSEHFCLTGAVITPLTPAGRATAILLQFNHPDRVAERQLLVDAGMYHSAPSSPDGAIDADSSD